MIDNQAAQLGPDGLRDREAVESELARPRNLDVYAGAGRGGPGCRVYVNGLVRNHGFADGNKRTAWIAARLFLADNGYRLRIDLADAIRTMKMVRVGELGEAALPEWI